MFHFNKGNQNQIYIFSRATSAYAHEGFITSHCLYFYDFFTILVDFRNFLLHCRLFYVVCPMLFVLLGSGLRNLAGLRDTDSLLYEKKFVGVGIRTRGRCLHIEAITDCATSAPVFNPLFLSKPSSWTPNNRMRN